MSKPPQSWLPNLVGGVSIWKLASDLNDPKHFDGRLLEPETEGSDSLPTKVSWDLTGMIPLNEARQKHPQEAERAVGEFVACLKRVSAEFDDQDSGYHKFKEAFTVPGLDADEGAHYHYHPAEKKLYVINWGASPRTLRQEQNFLFGYGSFDDLYDGDVPDEVSTGASAESAAGEPPAAGAAIAAGQTTPAAEAPKDTDAEGKKKDEKKDDDEQEESDDKPWWLWVVIGVLAIALIVAALLLLGECQDPSADAGASSGSAAAASGGAGGAGQGGATATNTAPGGGGGKSGAGGGGDKSGGQGGAGGGQGGASGAGDGGSGGGGQGGGDAEGGGEGGGSGDPGDFEAPVVVVPTGSGGGGKVIVINPGGAPPSQSAPHRVHFHPQAQRWRIHKGHQHVALVEAGDGKYDVYLKPGRSFRDVKVQWQDRGGAWHDH